MNTLIQADNSWALFAILCVIAAGSLILEQRYKWASRVTGCVIALIGAMILSNLSIIPTDAPAYDFVWDYVVPLAIPPLLFHADVRKIAKQSGRVLGIYLLSGAGTIVGAFLAFALLSQNIPAAPGVSAMMTGTYTGGSVNLVAMADSFKVSGDVVSSSIVADNLLMALYFFVLVIIPSSNFFLKRFRHPIIEAQNSAGESGKNNAAEFWKAKPVSLVDIALVFAISFAIVAVSHNLGNFLGGLFPEKPDNIVVALIKGLLSSKYMLMTSFTMLLATVFPRFFGNLAGAQEIGTFMIHIFFTVIGVPASIYLIITQAPLLLVFCAIIVGMNMLFSFGFGRLFKFNIEEICVASNANVGGPTTAAALAVSKGWNELIIPAILVGTLGYVIGNYYGLFVGTILGG